MPTDKEVFCRTIRARSYEHREAVKLLNEGGVTSQVISILRQELDSMVRVIYLHSITDISYRNKLIKDTLTGKQWKKKGSSAKVTDREMVDLASNLHGWTASVYSFGCAFIHLSNLHDYNDTDPFHLISPQDKAVIISYMNHYHQSPAGPNVKFKDLISFLPAVFDKIASNIEYEIQSLEQAP